MDGASPSSVDPKSGFCAATMTFHSLRAPVALPPPSRPFSVASFAFSLLSSSEPPPNHRDLPAFVDASSRGGASLSYPEFLSQVSTLASSLRLRLGLRRGDVAFVLSHARVEVPVLYFALLSIGAIVSPSNPASTPQEISRQLHLSGPSVAFTTSRDAHKLAPLGVPTVLLDSALFCSLVHESNTTAEETDDTGVAVHQSDVAAIMFSSGTSGLPKAAAIPHRSFIAMVACFHALRREGASTPQVTLLAAPPFHIMGFFFLLKGVALGESTLVMGQMGLPGMLRVAERHGATQITTSPPLLLAMSRWEGEAGVELRALECVLSGGAPLPEEVAERFVARFPWVLIEQGYGSTEGGGIARTITREECRQHRSIGRLNQNLEAKVVNHISGEAMTVGQRGELWVRGPHIMKGYLGNNDANATSFVAGGWLKTGDLCFFDEDGFLYVVDRLKEMIKYKGYQVAPAELEQLLQTLPEVLDAAVIPYPHEEAGQIPMAFVVRQQGSTLTESEVIEFIAKQVSPYKKIRRVAFISSIPKSPSGKILRRALATQAISASVSRF